MIQLHPPLSGIKSSYQAWLRPASAEATVEATAKAAPDAANPEAIQTDLPPAGPPDWVADAIRRQAAAQPAVCAPSSGDLIVLSPNCGAAEIGDALPLLMLLDAGRGTYWSGWLVGAHPDYAGDRDLVLERRLLLDDCDPAPVAAMVQAWNHFHRHLPACVTVLHRLTPQGLQAVRELSLAGIEPSMAPAPGRMQTRRLAQSTVITGTPYGRHDPRDDYLLLCRELANTISEPHLERSDRQYGDDEAEY